MLMKHSQTLRRFTHLAMYVAMMGALPHAFAASLPENKDPNHCGPLRNAYGPFDYRTEHEKLAIVEAHHFTPEVESLSRGQEGYIGGDIDYTLRASPNHHRALIAMMRLSTQLKDQLPKGMNRSVECYFDKAIRFAPDDPLVRVIYAQFLVEHARQTEALAQLDAAAQNALDNPYTHYNVGLAYFELNAYDKALEQAHIARSLGFERDALIEKLKGVNQWHESEPPSTKASASQSP